MGAKNLDIIDMRKHCGLNNVILNFDAGEILFAKEMKRDNKHFYTICRYIIEKDITEEMYHYEIREDDFYKQYAHVAGQKIIIIKLQPRNANSIEVDVLDKVSGKRISGHFFETDGEATSIPIFINGRYFLFYADIEGTEKEIHYKEQGFESLLYLCDLTEDKIYLVKDLKLAGGVSVVHQALGRMPVFLHKGEEYLLFNETYMDDYEYEEDLYAAVQENRVDKNSVTETEALYYIRVDDFAQNIKAGQNIPFIEISKRYIDGWVRYLRMDEENIYFRDKDFNTQLEKIYAVNMQNFKPVLKKEINHQEVKGTLDYGDKIYDIVDSQDRIKIRKIHEGDNHWSVEKTEEHVFFQELLNDRYIVAYSWMEDEQAKYFEFVYIFDTADGSYTKYDGTCEINGNQIVLYHLSDYS